MLNIHESTSFDLKPQNRDSYLTDSRKVVRHFSPVCTRKCSGRLRAFSMRHGTTSSLLYAPAALGYCHQNRLSLIHTFYEYGVPLKSGQKEFVLFEILNTLCRLSYFTPQYFFVMAREIKCRKHSIFYIHRICSWQKKKKKNNT